MKIVRINSDAEMLQFLRDSDLTTPEIKTILEKAYKIYIAGDERKEDIIAGLEKIFDNYSDQAEKPIFLVD